MPKRRLYSQIFYKEADSATATYVRGQRVPTGYILYVTHACVEDEDTQNCELAFGKFIDERFVPFEEVRNQPSGVRWNTANTHHFNAHEQPCFRVEGATLGDKIRGYAEGYFIEAEDV